MNNARLVDPQDLEIKLGQYRVGNAMYLTDPTLLGLVQDYKRHVSGRMIPLDRSELEKKVPPAEYWASRKLDGEFSVLIHRHGQTILLNPGGTVRWGMPFFSEVEAVFQEHGISNAILAGELHLDPVIKRERIHDVVRLARAPETVADLESLRFSVFDVLELNQERRWAEYATTWNKIEELFSQSRTVRPVPTAKIKSTNEAVACYSEHVERAGAEGIVLRSDTAGMFKIKPRLTLDAVVIGFTESVGERAGMMHDLLLAVRRADGTFHVLCRVGGGFTEERRRELLADLKDLIVDSEYAEVNSDREAYQMVEPKLVVEINCLDLISQSTRGAPIQRMTLHWDPTARKYQVVRRLPLVSVISPQFVRVREDKSIAVDDIRIAQVSQVVDVPLVDRDARQMNLPASEVTHREVYTKQLKGETMVRKFVIWKTNKDSVSAEFPAWVLHYTDFSPNRATPLAREVRVSSSAEQILQLFQELKEENIKKGWEPVGATPAAEPVKPANASDDSAAETSSTPAAKPAKTPRKVTSKKTAAPDASVASIAPESNASVAEPKADPPIAPPIDPPAKSTRKKKSS
ncbi:MAG: hypothetical protein JNK57_14995 [Planctomycetaceae bacterium]|nr:hypothetical protein [Planctomycetaceae bacterium]